MPIRDEQLQFSPSTNVREIGTTYVQSSATRVRDARFYVSKVQATEQMSQVGMVNIYPAGDEAETGPIQKVIIPVTAGQVTGSGITVETPVASGLTPTAANISEALNTPGDSKYVLFTFVDTNTRRLGMWFGINQFPVLANKRILNVSLLYSGWVVDADPETGNAIPFVSPDTTNPLTLIRQCTDNNFFGVVFWSSQQSNTGALTDLGVSVDNPSGDANQSSVIGSVNLGDVNNYWDTSSSTPASTSVAQPRLPWRYVDLQRFEYSYGAGRQFIMLGVQLPETPGTALGGIPVVAIDYMALQVTYCEETRVAYGGKLFRYDRGVNIIPMRDTSFNTDPNLAAGTYTPTLSWVSAGDVDQNTSENGDFPELNATRELYALPSHPTVQVNIPTPLADSIGETFTKETTHVLPQLSLHSSGGTLTGPQVYGRQAAAQVYGSVTATQEIYDGIVDGSASYPQVRYYARRFGNTTESLTLTGATVGGLYVAGEAGSNATTPDTAVLDITGDIDLRADLTMADWSSGFYETVISKWNQDGVNQRSYLLQVTDTGTIQIGWSSDGISGISRVSTAAVSAPNGTRLAIRATLDVDNGAAGHTATFYTAPTMAGPWTQLGSAVVTAGVTSIFNSTTQLEISGHSGAVGTDVVPYVVHSARVISGINGTEVANPDFDAQPAGTTSFVDDAGRTWTINGSAAIVAGISPVYGGLRLPGTAGNYASTPDNAALDITGDIDIRCDLTPDSWQPAAGSVLVAKWTEPGNQRAYLFYLGTDGALNVVWSTNGTATVFAASTVPVSATASGRLAVRVTLDVDNGAAGNTVTFYTASTLDGTWTQLGAQVTQAGVTSIGNSTAVLEVGSHSNGTSGLLKGTVHAAEVYNGIAGTVVANPDFEAQPAGTTNFVDDAGRTWTINGASAAIVEGSPGSVASITPTEFDELDEILDGWKEITLRFDSAPSMGLLLSPEWTWSAAGETAGNRWEILSAAAPAISGAVPGSAYTLVPSPNQLSEATYQPPAGSTVELTWMPQGIGSPWVTGATSDSTTDAVLIFAQDPPTVTGFTFNLESQPLTGIGQNCDTDPALIPNELTYVELSWSATSSGSVPVSGFGYYEIQRMDDLTDWQTIAKLTSPSATGFNDFEARIGILTDYRIRAVDVYDFAGSWSSTISTTIPAPGVNGTEIFANDHILTFTSNSSQSGAYNLAYALAFDGTPIEDFSFPESQTVQLQPMFDRDYFTAFRPLERGGSQFSRQLLVQNAAISPETLPDFTSLRDMAWATLPYVCVRDEDGNRWFATVNVPAGNVMRNRSTYLAQVGIAEVTATAAEVTI